jgi:Recombination endonuclease VII
MVIATQSRRARKFRMSEENLLLMLAAETCCQICGSPFGPENVACVDHSHETGLARSMLCNACNLGLGLLETILRCCCTRRNISLACRQRLGRLEKVVGWGYILAMVEKVQIIEGWTEEHGGVVRDVWRVPIDGQMMTLVTSSSSTTVMDETVIVCNDILKQLANL